MRKLLKALGLALASLALMLGLGVTPAAAANGLEARPAANGLHAPTSRLAMPQGLPRGQTIVHSKWSDRSHLKVSNYWDGKKGSTKKFVPRGHKSVVKAVRSFYVPKGCVGLIATRDHVQISKRPSGWQNLKSPIYALGYWQIELWCQTGGGGGGGGSW